MLSSGRIFLSASSSFSSLSSLDSKYNCIKPANFMTDPVARYVCFPAFMSIVVLSIIAGFIWQATNLFQIRVYNFNWSGFRLVFIVSGLRVTKVGRMASWASWADFFDLYKWGVSGKNSCPMLSFIYFLTKSKASLAIRTESVRM